MPIHLVLSGSLPLKMGRQLYAVAHPMAQHWAVHPSLCQGGGGIWGPPCSRVTPATALHVASTQSKPHPRLPLQKYEIGVKEIVRQWADRVLERLNNERDEQRVVQQSDQ
jgi:hypothetical protein